MAKIIPIDEHFQHFLAELKESFWGDLYGQTRQAWQKFFELESQRERDRFSGWAAYERRPGKRRCGSTRRSASTAASSCRPRPTAPTTAWCSMGSR